MSTETTEERVLLFTREDHEREPRHRWCGVAVVTPAGSTEGQVMDARMMPARDDLDRWFEGWADGWRAAMFEVKRRGQ
jgi:hypothetical protein